MARRCLALIIGSIRFNPDFTFILYVLKGMIATRMSAPLCLRRSSKSSSQRRNISRRSISNLFWQVTMNSALALRTRWMEQPLPQHHAPLAAPAGLDLGGGIVFELDDLHHRLLPLPQHSDLPPHHELGRILRGEVDGGQERCFELQQPRLALRPLRSDYPASNLGLYLGGVFEVALNPSQTCTSIGRSRKTYIDTELHRYFPCTELLMI